MALDKEETNRSYLYGRLLAVADRIEYRTYDEKDKARVTNAKRYMSTFSQRPFETWKMIEEISSPICINWNFRSDVFMKTCCMRSMAYSMWTALVITASWMDYIC